jgi:hypothetical protein
VSLVERNSCFKEEGNLDDKAGDDACGNTGVCTADPEALDVVSDDEKDGEAM